MTKRKFCDIEAECSDIEFESDDELIDDGICSEPESELIDDGICSEPENELIDDGICSEPESELNDNIDIKTIDDEFDKSDIIDYKTVYESKWIDFISNASYSKICFIIKHFINDWEILESGIITNCDGVVDEKQTFECSIGLAKKFFLHANDTPLSPPAIVRFRMSFYILRLTPLYNRIKELYTTNTITENDYDIETCKCSIILEKMFFIFRVARGYSRFFIHQYVSSVELSEDSFYNNIQPCDLIRTCNELPNNKHTPPRIKGLLMVINYFMMHGYMRLGNNVLQPVDMHKRQGVYKFIDDLDTGNPKTVSDIVSEISNNSSISYADVKHDCLYVSSYMQNLDSFIFPVYRPHNRAFGFKNGVLICDMDCDRFVKWNSNDIRAGVIITNLLIDSHQNEIMYDETLSTNIEYFGEYKHNITFDNDGIQRDVGGWFDIETPMWDLMLRTHYGDDKDCEDIMRMFYVSIGRLFFKVREMDNWQRILSITGITGSGCEYIVKIIQSIVGSHNIGIVNGVMETTFGLTNFINKLIWCVDNINEKTMFDQSDVFSMVAGEAITIRRKHMTPLSLDWDLPGLLVGTALPSKWSAQEGALERRLIQFNFNQILPHHVNEYTLMCERANLIPKCIRAYLSCVKYINDGKVENFESLLPLTMKNSAKQMVDSESKIYREFLNCGKFSFGETRSIPVDIFNNKLKEYMRESYPNIYKVPFYESYFIDAFKEHSLQLTSVVYRNKELKNIPSIIGCSYNDDRHVDDDDDTCTDYDYFDSNDSDYDESNVVSVENDIEHFNILTQRINDDDDENVEFTIRDIPLMTLNMLRCQILDLDHDRLLALLYNLFHCITGGVDYWGVSERKQELFERTCTHLICDNIVECLENIKKYRAVGLMIRIRLACLNEEIENNPDDFNVIHCQYLYFMNRIDAIEECITWVFAQRTHNYNCTKHFDMRSAFIDNILINLDGCLGVDCNTHPLHEIDNCIGNITRLNAMTRRGNNIHRPVFNDNGRFVFAYKSYKTLDDFVFNIGIHPMYSSTWLQMVKKSPFNTLMYNLRHSDDYKLPLLIRDRCLFSFHNGVYNLRDDSFKEWNDMTQMLFRNESKYSCVYHDVVFDHVKPSNHYRWDNLSEWFYDFDTSYIDCIFEKQFGVDAIDPTKRLSQKSFLEYISQIYAFTARMFYDVNEFDNWHKHLMLIGSAQSGKSLYIELMKRMYEVSDVGVISTQIEQMFGLETLFNSYLVVLPDIRKGLNLAASDFVAMVKGKSVSVRSKGKNALTIPKWKSQLLSAGNEFPFTTTSGHNVADCILPIIMHTKVTKPDPMLLQKCLSQIPMFIQKCVKLYKAFINHVNDSNIDTCIHESFKMGIAKFKSEYNHIDAFLNSDELVYSNDTYIPLNILQKQFNYYCLRKYNIINKKPIDIAVLKQHGLKVYDSMEITSNDVGDKLFGEMFSGIKTHIEVVYPISLNAIKHTNRHKFTCRGKIVVGVNVFDDITNDNVMFIDT